MSNYSQNGTVFNEIMLLVLTFYKIIKHYHRFIKCIFYNSQVTLIFMHHITKAFTCFSKAGSFVLQPNKLLRTSNFAVIEDKSSRFKHFNLVR